MEKRNLQHLSGRKVTIDRTGKVVKVNPDALEGYVAPGVLERARRPDGGITVPDRGTGSRSIPNGMARRALAEGRPN